MSWHSFMNADFFLPAGQTVPSFVARGRGMKYKMYLEKTKQFITTSLQIIFLQHFHFFHLLIDI